MDFFLFFHFIEYAALPDDPFPVRFDRIWGICGSGSVFQGCGCRGLRYPSYLRMDIMVWQNAFYYIRRLRLHLYFAFICGSSTGIPNA